MLRKEYIRGRNNELLGIETSGFPDGTTTARDRSGKLLGWSNTKIGTTRDADGGTVSRNHADAGLLIGKRTEK